MALRFSKVLHDTNSIPLVTNDVVGGNSFMHDADRSYLWLAPARYSEIRKLTFYGMYTRANTALSPEPTGFRLRVFAVDQENNSLNLVRRSVPQGGTQGLSSSVDGYGFADVSVSANANTIFSKAGSFLPLPIAGSALLTRYGMFQLEFDVFDETSRELFDDISGISDPDVHVMFGICLEADGQVISGSSNILQRALGLVVTQAPSANNKTCTYIPIHHARSTSGTGQSDFDANLGSGQTRGHPGFIYNADDWDGITEMNVLALGGTKGNTGSVQVRADRVNNAAGDFNTSLTGSTTTQIIPTEFITQTDGPGSYGFYRMNSILDDVQDGDWICFDYRHTNNPIGGGDSGEWSAWLEIVQENCSRTGTAFTAGANGAISGLATFVFPLPAASLESSLFDPQFFQDYPDNLFLRRIITAGILEGQVGNFDFRTDIVAYSRLSDELDFGTGGSGGSSPFGLVLNPACLVTQATPNGWNRQERPIGTGTTIADPLNLFGQRVLVARFDGDTNLPNTNAHSNAHLFYSFLVPESDVLELGPLFALDTFTPDGCQSTAAGGGENPGVLALANGSGRTRKFNPDDASITFLGIDPPFRGEQPSATTFDSAQSPEGSLGLGTYSYRYTLKNSKTGHESNPSPENFDVDTSGQSPRAGVNLSFAGITIPGDPQIDRICIYRGQVGVSEVALLRKVGELDIDLAATTPFVDTLGDEVFDDLDDPLPTLSLLNGVPPCSPIIVEFRNRLVALGDLPQLSPAGTVSVTQGSKEITGSFDVEWDNCLLGRFIQVAGDGQKYEIEEILPPLEGSSPPIQRLRITEEYEGTTGTGLNYIICGRPNRVYFSEPIDPESWPESSFIDVEPGDGDRIQGAISNYDSLLICKRNKSYVLRFSLNPVLEVNVPSRVSSDIGCIAPRSFAQVAVGSVFLADRGLALFDGRSVNHLPESDLVNDLFVDPTHPLYVMRDRNGRVPGAIGKFYPRREQYLLLLPTVSSARGGANLLLVWDVSLRNITFLEFCQEFTAMEVAKDEDGNERVYLGDANGFVWIYDSGFTDGAGYENATGTVRGNVTSAGLDAQGASFLSDSTAAFVTGGVPGLADLSGVSGLSGFGGSNNMGLAGACLFTRAANAAVGTAWTQRFIYASTRDTIYVTPGWGPDTPSVGDDYMIGAIEFVANFKPRTFLMDDTIKRQWKSVLSFIPETQPSKLRIEHLMDFETLDRRDAGIQNADGTTGRIFNLSDNEGRQERMGARELFTYLQLRMSNFAPDEPVRLLNHHIRVEGKNQQG